MKRIHKSKVQDIALSNAEFHKIINKAYIIDVRSSTEYMVLPKIKQGVNIYVSDLVADPAQFLTDPDQLIVTYCNAGNRSGHAANELRSAGYNNAFVLKDGVYGYNR